MEKVRRELGAAVRWWELTRQKWGPVYPQNAEKSLSDRPLRSFVSVVARAACDSQREEAEGEYFCQASHVNAVRACLKRV